MTDFADMIEKERARLNKLKEDALTRRSAIDDEVKGYDVELKAIVAYETAKTGKKSTGTRAPRGTRREGLLTLIKQHPDGIGRADILAKLGLKGNKAGEGSISNALANLKKQNKIGSKGGLYTPA